ncbi:MAG: hypothetical protein U0941_14140 [Planctomycetaceae bacterium]
MESSDAFVLGAEIPSDRITYFVKAADRISVEFWNSLDDMEATRVVLPRALIREWVNYITTHNVPADTTARQIRDGVASTTKYSNQLNSFETHLKAAAFAEIAALRSAKTQRCYEIVAVGADWTSNEHILGYHDGLDRTRYVKTRVLDLIMRAVQEPRLPHFLILDEMNLSHVERYFADLLSAIESGEPLHLHTATNDDGSPAFPSGVPGNIVLPPNLFVVGTVNIDETTYMFSPKVLDRANVLEFRVTEDQMSQFLANQHATELRLVDGKGEMFATAFVNASGANAIFDAGAQLETELSLWFKVLKLCNSEFGFRTAREMSSFIHHHKSMSDGEWKFRAAFDAQIAQKLLPKLHGSRAKLEPILCALGILCFEEREASSESESADRYQVILDRSVRALTLEDETLDPLRTNPDGTAFYGTNDAYFPHSFAKVIQMLALVRCNGFASFAEA